MNLVSTILLSCLTISQLNISYLCPQTFEEFFKKQLLNFTIHLEEQQYLVYEPIFIHCVIENPTSDSIPARTPSGFVPIRIHLINADGDTVQCSDLIVVSSGAYSTDTEPYIKPNESYYVLKKCDSKLEPGDYTLQVLYPADLYYYRDLWEGDSETKQHYKYPEIKRRRYLQMKNIGAIYSNKVTFSVICPQNEIDKKAYDLLEKSLEEREKRRGKDYHKYFDATVRLVEAYPNHPYSLKVYHSYLYHLARTDLEKYRALKEYVITTFPNTYYHYEEIRSEAVNMDREEREEYFNELRFEYKDQWVELYVNQLDRRFKWAEARGWHKDRDEERQKELKKVYDEAKRKQHTH